MIMLCYPWCVGHYWTRVEKLVSELKRSLAPLGPFPLVPSCPPAPLCHFPQFHFYVFVIVISIFLSHCCCCCRCCCCRCYYCNKIKTNPKLLARVMGQVSCRYLVAVAAEDATPTRPTFFHVCSRRWLLLLLPRCAYAACSAHTQRRLLISFWNHKDAQNPLPTHTDTETRTLGTWIQSVTWQFVQVSLRLANDLAPLYGIKRQSGSTHSNSNTATQQYSNRQYSQQYNKTNNNNNRNNSNYFKSLSSAKFVLDLNLLNIARNVVRIQLGEQLQLESILNML